MTSCKWRYRLMHARWLVLLLFGLRMLAATGGGGWRGGGRYGRYGYGGVYDQRGPGIYSQQDRHYRWERQQRLWEEGRHKQLRYERYKERRHRHWQRDRRR